MHRFLHIFLYGVFAACFALILELILFGVLPLEFFGFLNAEPARSLSLAAFLGLFFFALLEEGSRAVFLLRYKKNISRGPVPFLGNQLWLSGGAFGAGFAGLEVLASALFADASRGSFLPGSFLLHVFFSIGMAFPIFRWQRNRPVFGILFSLAVILHLLYNVFILRS